MDIAHIVAGDMHGKQKWILPYIDMAAVKLRGMGFRIAEIIFLGDYVDDYHIADVDMLNALDIQIEWMGRQSIRVINLCGNHDFAYLYFGECSGHRPGIADGIKARLKMLHTRMAWNIRDKVLITHAGVSSKWWDAVSDRAGCGGSMGAAQMASTLNAFAGDADLLQELNACGSMRGGSDAVSGPLWVSRQEITSSALPVGIAQVTGHNIVDTVERQRQYYSQDFIYFCDTFTSNMENGIIGDGSILIIFEEDSRDTLTCSRLHPKDVGFPAWDEIAARYIFNSIDLPPEYLS